MVEMLVIHHFNKNTHVNKKLTKFLLS